MCACEDCSRESMGFILKKKRNLSGIRTQKSRMEESMTRYLLMGTAAALLFFSILCRFFPGMRLKRLLGETANLSVSPNTILRQCVLKYSGLCELNGGRINTPVYVEKFLRQLKFGRFSLRFWDRLGGQLLLLSVFADGIGACMGLMDGQTLGNVIWFYLQAFLSLYLYFTAVGMIDTASMAEELKITLADFLENRMSQRLAQVKRDSDYLDEQEREVRREVESVGQTAAVCRMQEPRAAEPELQRWKGEIAPQLESDQGCRERTTAESVASSELTELLQEFLA